MTAWVALLTALLFALNIGRITPVDGARFIDRATLCVDPQQPETCTDVTLPYHSERPFDEGTLTRTLIAQITFDTVPDTVQALYLPKLADTVTVTLNDVTLFEPRDDVRLWSTPLLVSLPPALLRAGQNTVTLTLEGPGPEGLDLWQFHVGPHAVLAQSHATRFAIGQGVARFSMGLMGVLAAALLLIWWNRRAEMHYFWLAASCLSALFILTHYAFGTSIGSYKIWTILWPFSAAVYVFTILKFLRHLVSLPVLLLEKAHLGMILLCLVTALILPGGYTFAMAVTVNTLSAPSAVAVLVILWMRRTDLPGPDFPVFFVCISLAVTLGIYSLIITALPHTPRSLPLFQVMPTVMSFACVYLILSKFLQSLRGYEQLTDTLNQTLGQRTAELEQSFTRLAETEKREAIAQERSRIMLDLHDGLGGQLVNTLAYIRRTGSGDDTIRRALEDALRDLAMMLDSVESQESLVTLLGMMRTRLEGLLADNGIAFDWQIGEEPVAPVSGPSPNLNLARIVQEAITNVIKHADASVIRVATDARTITISDNGRGFDAQANCASDRGHGISNMTRRAEALGAGLKVASGSTGTEITLTFPEVPLP
ncbi:MAG: hypothetical protein Gyms2KO_29870 [Gymnodinialimonas sp.]